MQMSSKVTKKENDYHKCECSHIDEELRKSGIFIAPGSTICCPKCVVGVFTRINGPIEIKGTAACFIGKYCAIGDGVRIITDNHDMERANLQYTLNARHGFCGLSKSKGDVKIGNNVWIGDRAIILSGVQVGDGAVIGAGAVISKNVEPFSISVGVPARSVKKRFSEYIISQLLEIRWWNWPEEKISRNKIFFETNLVDNPDLDLASIVRP